MYENLTMEDRIDRIGGILAKAVYLYHLNMKKGKEDGCEEEKNSRRKKDRPDD